MKTKNIMHALNDIDFDMIENAEAKKKTSKNIWLKWGSIAACFALVLAVGVYVLPKLNTSSTLIDGIERRYKEGMISAGETYIEWPWEYKTLSEKYTQIVFNGTEYRTRSQTIGKEYLGESLGSCKANGFDTYTDKSYSEEFEVRAIKGIDSNHLVAVNMDGEFITFLLDDNPFPATFGEFINTYTLNETLPFNRYSEQEGNKNKGYYLVNDDDYVWQILSECTDAPWVADDHWSRSDRNYISFTATSEALGVYKKVFYVTEDGYVRTNIMEYGYTYEIGSEAAEKIIRYVRENSEEVKSEPYHKSVSGTVVEIGDDYILIDDSVLCVNKNEGMVFKIPADDLRIRRTLIAPYGTVKVGDIVMVEYTGTIDTENNNTVDGAFSVNKGTLVDGGLAIPE